MTAVSACRAGVPVPAECLVPGGGAAAGACRARRHACLVSGCRRRGAAVRAARREARAMAPRARGKRVSPVESCGWTALGPSAR